MRFINYVASLAWLSSTVSAFDLHSLLQVPPSFARNGINLYPALHPEHDHSDLNHLGPSTFQRIILQPGGASTCHAWCQTCSVASNLLGSHGYVGAFRFYQDIVCDDNNIKICFKTPEAFVTVEKSWKKEINSTKFNLIIYHIGCGHLTGEYRAFFRASRPIFDGNAECVTVAAELIDEKEALHAGELAWGTYVNPHLAKREPVRGHVRVVKPDQEVLSGGNNTINFTTDPKAVKQFFGTPNITTDMPDTMMEGLDSLSDAEDDELMRRGLFSWIVEGIKSLVGMIQDAIERTIKIIRIVATVVIARAAVAISLLMVPFGFPFEQAYHSDISFNKRVDGVGFGTDLGSSLGGTSNNLVLSKKGAAAWIECKSCGAQANFSFDGKLAFSISQGLYKAEESFINRDPFVIDAIFGITIDARSFKDKGKKFKTTIEKQLRALPIPDVSISIPKILTIGAQVTINAAASIYADAHGEIEAGARFSISEGRLVLNAKEYDKNEASGFKPSLDPVFKVKKGSIVTTADLALPIGLEMGLDVLGGTWKKTIGVYTAPSIYFTAGLSTGEDHACDGLELRVGAKNRIYSSALGIWEYEFKQLGHTFYETGIGCLSLNGWNSIAEKFGGEKNLASDQTLNLTQPDTIIHDDEHFKAENKGKDQNKLRKLPKTHGFRLIQDAGQTATLVSGTDGYIYMAKNSDYDISSPWGALELKKNVFSYGVFGRLIYYNYDRLDFSKRPNLLVEVGVSHAEKMPKGAKAATLSVIEDDKKTETYGVEFTTKFTQSGQWIWLPTVCQIPGHGLRLYASIYLVDADGIARNPLNPEKNHKLLQSQYRGDGRVLGLGKDPKVCRTVRLTSDPKSTT